MLCCLNYYLLLLILFIILLVVLISNGGVDAGPSLDFLRRQPVAHTTLLLLLNSW